MDQSSPHHMRSYVDRVDWIWEAVESSTTSEAGNGHGNRPPTYKHCNLMKWESWNIIEKQGSTSHNLKIPTMKKNIYRNMSPHHSSVLVCVKCSLQTFFGSYNEPRKSPVDSMRWTVEPLFDSRSYDFVSSRTDMMRTAHVAVANVDVSTSPSEKRRNILTKWA